MASQEEKAPDMTEEEIEVLLDEYAKVSHRFGREDSGFRTEAEYSMEGDNGSG